MWAGHRNVTSCSRPGKWVGEGLAVEFVYRLRTSFRLGVVLKVIENKAPCGEGSPRVEAHFRVQKSLVGWAGLVLSIAVAARGQAPVASPTGSTGAQERSSGSEMHANPDEVLIDLVVRDKKNRPVTNLTPADFVVKDGTKTVQLANLHLVTTESGASDTIVLLFDQMPAESDRVAAELAAKIAATAPERTEFAVFGVDRGLRLLASFSQDRAATNRAVASALGPIPEHELVNAEKETLSIAQTGAGVSGEHASVEERALAGMMVSALEDSQRIRREQHAPASLAGLLALSKAQQGRVGRKVIVFFSAGLRTGANGDTLLEEVVESANRAGITIYAVDTSAVDTKSFDMLTMMYQQSGGLPVRNTPGVAGITMAPNMSRIELMQNSTEDAQSVTTLQRDRSEARGNALAFLSKGTGGFVIRGDEKAREPLQRMMADIATYYEASYTPELKAYDGQFHSLEMEPIRAGITIRSRAGYFAVSPGTGDMQTIRPFEAPLMSALSQTPLPAGVSFRQVVLSMGGAPDRPTSELAIEVPLAQVDLREDQRTQLYAGHLSILTQVLDKSGVAIERFSDDERRMGALEAVEGARSDVVTFQRHFAASPGDYVLETVVLDRNSGKAGVLRTEFSVSAIGNGPWLSDVAMVRRLQPLAGEADLEEPLSYDKSLAVPNIGHVIAEGAPRQKFLLRMHGSDKGSGGKLDVVVDRGGQVVSHSSIEVAGEVRDHLNLAAIDTASLMPGEYRALFTYTEGEMRAEREVRFTISGDTKAAANEDNVSAESDEAADPDVDFEAGLANYTATSGASGSTQPDAKYVDGLLSGARSRALGYLDSLANFKCIEVTDRYVDPKGTGKWSRHDKIAELVTYENREETRNVLEVNGDPSNRHPADLKGGRLEGEFGGVLQIVFDPAANAEFEWKEKGMLGGAAVDVFTYRVGQKDSKFSVTALPDMPLLVAFHGMVYIDSATRSVRRISIEAEDIPEKSPVHASAVTIDYGYVAINNHDYLMPVHGQMNMQLGKREKIQHRIEFRDYHRFGSEARIVGVEQRQP